MEGSVVITPAQLDLETLVAVYVCGQSTKWDM